MAKKKKVKKVNTRAGFRAVGDERLPNLIARMVKDRRFAAAVVKDPTKFQTRYNLTPANIKALRAANIKTLTTPRLAASGGCYYGG